MNDQSEYSFYRICWKNPNNNHFHDYWLEYYHIDESGKIDMQVVAAVENQSVTGNYVELPATGHGVVPTSQPSPVSLYETVCALQKAQRQSIQETVEVLGRLGYVIIKK